ncbi:MAG: ABC transporter permease subunit [Nannocystis sp.]|nr:ABC transporter permease subunit [Nannocystis sp.]
MTAFLLFACNQSRPVGDTLSKVEAAGLLRWGADLQGGAPYIYEDPAKDGAIKGFEVDLAAALAAELGVTPEFVQNDWSALVPSLERETFDIVMNGLEVTPARAGRVLFTRPYYIFTTRLMARRDDPRIEADLSKLKGMRVGTLTSSFTADLLLAVGIEPVYYEGQEEPYQDLIAGRLDAVFMDDIIAGRYGEDKPQLRVVGDLGDGFYAIAIRPGDEALRDALDRALGVLIENGALEQILRREQIWNDRQLGLRAWSDADQRRLLGEATQSGGLRWHHVVIFIEAAGITLVISLLSMALAIPLGMGLAVARLYGGPVARGLATAYVELYRGTPVLLQLYVLYYGLADLIRLDAFSAAIIGLGMNYAAYEAEVYRAGIQAVPRGQMEAALSLGMRSPLALRRVVLPQAFRIALPSVTNDFIALLKDSSLVSVITVVELTKRMTIVAVDVRSWLIPGALCALLYFVMSYPLSLFARRLERRLARS